MARDSKMQPDDRHPLEPYRWWQVFSRSLFHLNHADPVHGPEIWSVDVRHAGDSNGEVWAVLYREGVSRSRSRLPAAFAVSGGTIEVAVSMYGLKRVHYVSRDGSERQLSPDPASAEGRRARLERRRPALSRAISITSVGVLVIALVVGVPQIIEQVTQIPPIAAGVRTFESPLRLPVWANTSLLLAAVAASTERALRLRYNWILDGGVLDGDD